MPPKTRGGKVSKASKENIDAIPKSKSKTMSKATRPIRKALADKTNSASDDNASLLTSKPTKDIATSEHENLLVKQRPRRERRVPTRFIESNVLQKLSNSTTTDNEELKSTPVKKVPVVVITPLKIPVPDVISPLKTPKLNLDSSLPAQRPKRICRLPSKFDDHSVSPNKFVPVQPTYASTPKIQAKTTKNVEEKEQKKSEVRSPKKTPVPEKVISTKRNRKQTKKKANEVTKSNRADTNNNAKKERLPRNKTNIIRNTSPIETQNTKPVDKKLVDKNFSFKILEDKSKSLKRVSNIDPYEFTYDPNEEPPPQKKKRKKPAKKREPKPKTVIFNNNYDRNLAKVLSALKNTVATKATSKHDIDKEKGPYSKISTNPIPLTISSAEVISSPAPEPTQYAPPINPIAQDSVHNNEKSTVSERNYNSVRVEDIALDFEVDYDDNVNYSPVNTPCRPVTPAEHKSPVNTPCHPVTPAEHTANILNTQNAPHHDDPLNLRGDLSFFDDQPVASSSMNLSVRNPEASPWRVEFGNLPIKWQVNTYVKPNLTPAFESSFMNFNDNKKKYVYTNMGPDINEANDLPQIFEDNTSKLKQTSIISFIKEVVDRNGKKNKELRSNKEKMTPIKANSLFEDLNETSVCKNGLTKPVTPKKNTDVNTNHDVTPPSQEKSDVSNENRSENNSKEDDKENKGSSKDSIKKSSKKKKSRDVTYFGFDDSENQDEENVSPVKKVDKRKVRALRPRSRAVLQEINEQKGPTRAIVLVAMVSKPKDSSDAANDLFDQLKTATEPPVFPEKEQMPSTETTSLNITEIQGNESEKSNDDEGSVHLFEDVEPVHNLKAHRKSYGKTKKTVTFRQNSISDSDEPPSVIAEQSGSSDEDDLHDLTYKVPSMEPKKPAKKRKTKKQMLCKKEEQEANAWAAGFNSMCEEIEEFDLVVE